MKHSKKTEVAMVFLDSETLGAAGAILSLEGQNYQIGDIAWPELIRKAISNYLVDPNCALLPLPKGHSLLDKRLKKRAIGCRVEKDTYDHVRAIAEARGGSISSVFRQAVLVYLGKLHQNKINELN